VFACGIALTIAATPHIGFMLFLAIPFLAVWALYSGWILWKRPALRRLQWAKLALWMVSISAAVVMQMYMFHESRKAADEAVQAILNYHAQYKNYPQNLDMAYPQAPAMRKKWMLYYAYSPTEPNLFYRHSVTGFDTYVYHFADKEWVFQPD
jgi:hypothetical protein